jgi:ethanolamine utilization microcompartment shell protein EutL
MASEAMGILECKGLVALMEGTDAMLKTANVTMLGWDKCGSGMVTAFVKGDVAAVKAAVDAGAEAAGRTMNWPASRPSRSPRARNSFWEFFQGILSCQKKPDLAAHWD